MYPKQHVVTFNKYLLLMTKGTGGSLGPLSCSTSALLFGLASLRSGDGFSWRLHNPKFIVLMAGPSLLRSSALSPLTCSLLPAPSVPGPGLHPQSLKSSIPRGWAQTPQPADLAPSLTGGGLTRALMHGGQGATLFPVPPTMVWNVKAASQLGEC